MDNDLDLGKGISSGNFSQAYDDYLDDDYQLHEHNSDNLIQFITESEILNEREKIISEAMEKLFLDRDKSILAMIYYQWNVEKINEWYEDVDQNLIKAGIKISKSKLKQIGAETNGDNCLICYEEKNPNFFSLTCGHQFCRDCWTGYLREKIKSLLNALQVTCPQEGCTCIVNENIYLKFLKDKKSKDQLNKAIAKNFINKNEDIKQCPNPKCDLYVKSTVHSEREINCRCGTSYCFKCSKESHRPCTCEMNDKWNARSLNDSTDKKWIEANTKECPHCHQKIERSQGCNYMLCDKKAGGCGHAFCYVCETDWAKHSQNHFECNKYTEEVKKKEKNANKIKEELKRYDFYFTRFMNYKKAVSICDEKLRKSLADKVGILIEVKNLPVIETQFIIEALNTVIKGKRALKNTYIFGYYLKDSEKKVKFEFSQGYLESNAEILHKFLIDEHLDVIIETEEYNTFSNLWNSYKNNVNNLIGCVEKYLKGLIDEIENEYICDINYKLLDEK